MTTKMLAEIRRLAGAGFCDAEIARRTGLPHCTVRYWRIKEGIPIGKRCKGHNNPPKVYTFYDRRTTRFLCEGTLEECAPELGMALSSLRSIVSKTRSGKLNKYEIHEVTE